MVTIKKRMITTKVGIITSKSKSWLVLFILFSAVLTGCKKSTLTFTSMSELPYKENFNTCSLVESINNQTIPALLNNGVEITYKNETVYCNSNKVTIEPNKTISIDYDLSGQIFTKTVRFVQEGVTADTHKEDLEGGNNATPLEKPALSEQEREPDPVDDEESNEVEVQEQPQEEEGGNNVTPQVTAPKPPTVTENVGAHRQFLVSDSVSHVQAKEQCIAYINQYTNFRGCALLRDMNTLILGYETE